MRAGAMFPTRELPPYDRDGMRSWLDGVAACGFDHVIVADHVLGVDPTGAADWADSWPHPPSFRRAYTSEDVFHEPFVLLAWFAARTELELATGVLVLPQRQTVMVAKQAAELDVLCGGRLRLGVGAGWNRVEFEALGMPFRRRGRLLEEQVALLRRLWTERVVEFAGEFHSVRSAGLQLLPLQRPIPLWMGGDAPAVLERVGRLADGWYCNAREAPGPAFLAKVEAIRAAAAAAGRDAEGIGIQARQVVDHDDAALEAAIGEWRKHEVTHLTIDTMNVGRKTLGEHLRALRRAARVLGLL